MKKLLPRLDTAGAIDLLLRAFEQLLAFAREGFALLEKRDGAIEVGAAAFQLLDDRVDAVEFLLERFR